MANRTPLARYLAVQAVSDRELAAILLDAAKDGEARVLALGRRQGIGAAVGAAQYARVVAELRRTQTVLWPRINGALVSGLQQAAKAAADAENEVNRLLIGKKMGPTYKALEAAKQAQARATVNAFIARGENGISLSDQVYNTKALASGQIDREIGRGILLGEDWRSLANRVRRYIQPSVPGGVSYAAKRLGRTELNNAFHRVQIDQRSGEPWVTGFRWHLSDSHPKPDECNTNAQNVHYRGGDAGVYRVEDVPGKPHPNCLCYLTSEVVDSEEFLTNLSRGNYDSYLRSKTGRSFR